MFDYSKAAGNLILEDLKKWRNRFQIFFSLFTLAYLAYCLIRPVGIFYINLALAVIYVAYTVFQLITYKKENLLRSSFFIWYPILDLLHAHKVSPKGLCPSGLNLFAIRISFHSIRTQILQANSNRCLHRERY